MVIHERILQVKFNMLCDVVVVIADMEQSQPLSNSQLVSSKARQMNVLMSDRKTTAPYHMT